MIDLKSGGQQEADPVRRFIRPAGHLIGNGNVHGRGYADPSSRLFPSRIFSPRSIALWLPKRIN